MHEYLESCQYTLQKLIQEQETNTEEIKLFHRNKDLSTIPGFFRGIGSMLPLNQGSG